MVFRSETMIRKIVACFLLVYSLSFLLSGCDYTIYPEDIAARWVSTSPDITLEYQGEYPYESIEYLKVNEERIDVFILYFPGGDFKMIPASAVDKETNNIHMPTTTIYLSGKWKLLKNELIFYIKEDNLFGGIYEEIHFTREELEWQK